MALAPPRMRPSSRLSLIALALALIGSAAMLNYYLNWFLPRAREAKAARQLVGYSFGDDLYTIWYGSFAAMRAHSDLYTPEVARQIQKGLYGRPLDPLRPGDPKDLRIFGYPAFTVLLFWPFSLLSFEHARVIFLLIQIPLLIATAALWMRALALRPCRVSITILVLLLMTSYPALESLYAGQIGIFVCFVLAAAVIALQRDKLLFSGALMALGTVKPHVMLLPILYLGLWSLYDWRNRRMFWIGLLSMEALLVAAALIVWPNWIQSWLSVAIRYQGYTPPSLTIQMLTTLAGPAARPVALIVMIALLFFSLWISWKNRSASPESPEFRLTICILLAIAVGVLLPGHAVYDHLLLLPGIFLLAISWRSFPNTWATRALLAVAMGVLFWQWFAAVLLIPIHLILGRAQFYSMPVLGLPLRMAAGLPFIILALLALAYRSGAAQEKLSSASLVDQTL
jgi:hypothetical protein